MEFTMRGTWSDGTHGRVEPGSMEDVQLELEAYFRSTDPAEMVLIVRKGAGFDPIGLREDLDDIIDPSL